MNPSSGARVVLRLATDSEPVSYSVELYLPERALGGRASVRDGRVELTGEIGDAPEWTRTLVATLLRTAGRAAAGSGSWPRRITRWRAAPDD